MKNISVVIMLLLASASNAQVCKSEVEIPPTTPTSRFVDNGDGTVLDSDTGLMWQKCPLNRSGTDCLSGTLALLSVNWRQSLDAASNNTLAGFNDWRVPNIKELRSIVERRCFNPALNAAVFPNGFIESWSSTPSSINSAYYLQFRSGFDIIDLQTNVHNVRLVRDAQ